MIILPLTLLPHTHTSTNEQSPPIPTTVHTHLQHTTHPIQMNSLLLSLLQYSHTYTTHHTLYKWKISSYPYNRTHTHLQHTTHPIQMNSLLLSLLQYTHIYNTQHILYK